MIEKQLIKFNLRGRNVRPDTIGMGELGNLLNQFEAAIKGAVPLEELTSHANLRMPLVSLVEIREGNSSDMGMMVLDYAVPAVGDITEAIAGRTFNKLSNRSHQSLREIYRWTHKTHREFVVESNPELDISEAVISRKNPVPAIISDDQKIDGVTTAWGYLQQAGGQKPRAFLSFPDGSRVVVSADEIVTKQLGERLYEDVGIEGIATWRIRDRKMIAFKAIRVLDYRPSIVNLTETFARLAAASQGRWNGVDAAKFVKELRDETTP